MRISTAVALAGVTAGLTTAIAMTVGRKTGLLHKTLNRDSVDWIDDATRSRKVIGDGGTSAVELANHLDASIAFASLYPPVRRSLPGVHPTAIGAVAGGVLYLVNIAGIAPKLGITSGVAAAGPAKAAERLGIHALQMVVTALVIERLADRKDLEPSDA